MHAERRIVRGGEAAQRPLEQRRGGADQVGSPLAAKLHRALHPFEPRRGAVEFDVVGAGAVCAGGELRKAVGRRHDPDLHAAHFDDPRGGGFDLVAAGAGVLDAGAIQRRHGVDQPGFAEIEDVVVGERHEAHLAGLQDAHGGGVGLEAVELPRPPPARVAFRDRRFEIGENRIGGAHDVQRIAPEPLGRPLSQLLADAASQHEIAEKGQSDRIGHGIPQRVARWRQDTGPGRALEASGMRTLLGLGNGNGAGDCHLLRTTSP